MESREILKFLPEKMAKVMEKAALDWEQMEEIRLRAGKPLLFYMDNKEYVLKREGNFIKTSGQIEEGAYMTEASEIRQILDKVSGYSLYAYQDELCQGYFTLEGGHRMGLAGKIVTEEGKIRTIKYLSFLNIRVSHEKKGCGQVVIKKLIKGGQLLHTLILSPPGCGKTTLLRDLIRLISNGFYYFDEKQDKRNWFPGLTVGVVDERSEIGSCVKGIPTNDLGIRTDILDECPKAEGIFMLLRSMAPRVIAVDEIGNREDFFAIRQAVNSGCIILATAHGTSYRELSQKPLFAAFLEEHIFDRYIVLSGKQGKGTIEGIYRREETQ